MPTVVSSLAVTKSYVCCQMGGDEKDWVQILLGLNFSGNVGGVSDYV